MGIDSGIIMRGPVVCIHYASVRTTTGDGRSSGRNESRLGAYRPHVPRSGGGVVSRTDRGAERRRLLEAVRADGGTRLEEDSSPARGDRTTPTADAGTLSLAAPEIRCAECGRHYVEAPVTCDACGGTAFEDGAAD